MSNLFDQADQPDLHPAETAYYAAIAAHRTWHSAAEAAMRHLTDHGQDFSADDLRHLLADAGDPPHHNAIGGLFMAWSRAGLIHRTGGGTSTAPKRHGGHRHTWIGAQHAPTRVA